MSVEEAEEAAGSKLNSGAAEFVPCGQADDGAEEADEDDEDEDDDDDDDEYEDAPLSAEKPRM